MQGYFDTLVNDRNAESDFDHIPLVPDLQVSVTEMAVALGFKDG